MTAQPLESLYFSLAGSILESEFDSTVTDANGAILGGVQEGNRLASVPEFQFAATGSYLFPLQAFGGSDGSVTLTVQHVGDRITQPSDQTSGAGLFTSGLPFGGADGDELTIVDPELDPYTIVNLSASVEKNDWSAVIYVRNIGDTNANTSFDRERGGRARLGFRTNMPRTIGVTFRKSFSN